MIITQLEKDLVPYFIYLMDSIEVYLDGNIEIGKIFQEIREQENSCSWHAIQRAFHLREELRRDAPTGKGIHLPKKSTLDALMEYRYGEELIFRDLVNGSLGPENAKNFILEHYKENEPSPYALTRIFDKKNEKEHHIDGQRRILEDFKHDMVNQEQLDKVLVKLNIDVEKRFENLRKEIEDDIRLRDELIEKLEVQIKELKKKSKRVSVLRGFFGTFGAFLITINYNEDIINTFFNDFMDSTLAWTDDGFLDDLT